MSEFVCVNYATEAAIAVHPEKNLFVFADSTGSYPLNRTEEEQKICLRHVAKHYGHGEAAALREMIAMIMFTGRVSARGHWQLIEDMPDD